VQFAFCLITYFSDSRKESNDHVSTKSSSLPKHAYQISCMYISVFSSLGCVIRIGVDHAVGSDLANIENPGSVVFRSFFSNILGCYLLGILHSLPMDRGTYLFIGLSTGLFCAWGFPCKFAIELNMVLKLCRYLFLGLLAFSRWFLQTPVSTIFTFTVSKSSQLQVINLSKPHSASSSCTVIL